MGCSAGWRYYAAVVGGVVLAAVFWAGAIVLEMGAPTMGSRWYAEVLAIKTGFASSVSSPKIVVVGGSSVHFSVRTAQMERETGIPAVNMGTAVALELPYILETARRVARSGDLVVLSLEYELYRYQGEPTQPLLDQIFSRDPGYLSTLPIRTRVRYALGLSPRRVFEGVVARFAPPTGPMPPDVYRPETVNGHGDETMNQDSAITELDRAKVAAIVRGQKGSPMATDDSLACDVLGDFARWAASQNVDVVAVWPDIVYSPTADEPVSQPAYAWIRACYARLGVPLLGKPRDSMYDPSLFFDTGYHLADRGAALHTSYLVGLLRTSGARVFQAVQRAA